MREQWIVRRNSFRTFEAGAGMMMSLLTFHLGFVMFASVFPMKFTCACKQFHSPQRIRGEQSGILEPQIGVMKSRELTTNFACRDRLGIVLQWTSFVRGGRVFKFQNWLVRLLEFHTDTAANFEI